MHTIIGRKVSQSQKFLTDGTRIPVTRIAVADNAVVAVKNIEKHGYQAVQLGFGARKKPSKALVGHVKKANIDTVPFVIREVRFVDGSIDVLPNAGDMIKAQDVFKQGDIIQVTGTSKGKGFAGGVKRYGFHGGPRTHGQSDRERAPGSIGQTTTPGRVYKGKRMAGNMGRERTTVKNLVVVSVNDQTKEVLVSGLVPGSIGTVVIVKKIGEMSDKKFIPLHDNEQENAPEAVSETTDQVAEEKKEENKKV